MNLIQQNRKTFGLNPDKFQTNGNKHEYDSRKLALTTRPHGSIFHYYIGNLIDIQSLEAYHKIR